MPDSLGMDTIPLFDLPAQRQSAPTTRAQQDRAGRPTWAGHTGKRIACHHCVTRLHAHHGVGAPPRSARRVRTIRGERLHLCKECAAPLEAADKQAAGR